MRADIVCHGLEVPQQLLRLVDNGLVLENGAVVCEVDSGGLRGVVVRETHGVTISLAESLQRGNGFYIVGPRLLWRVVFHAKCKRTLSETE